MKKLLEAELNADENMIWCQQPHRFSLIKGSLPNFLFGIPFFTLPAFIIYHLAFLHGHETTWPALLAALSIVGIFAIFGLCLLLSPLWSFWKATRTLYAITDRRCIIISAPWKREIRSYLPGPSLGDIMDLHRTEDSQGRGDLVFHRQSIARRRGVFYQNIGFIGIDNVREVEGKVRKLIDTAFVV